LTVNPAPEAQDANLLQHFSMGVSFI
jgi:hypothetical protein